MNIQWFWSFLQGVGLLAFAPLFLGWLNWWKARLTHRKRPLTWIVQPYRDLFKLLRLPATHPKTASWVFRSAPYLIFAVYGSLLFMIPLWTRSLLPPDLLLILYLLGLGRFVLSLAGLDSAAAFGHLGSSREMFFHFLTEISLFPLLVAFWLWINETNKGQAVYWIATAAILASFFPVLLLEARRLPVDNPDTHLELTMAGKAVELEFSGRALALVEWGEINKLLFLVALWVYWFFGFLGISAIPEWLSGWIQIVLGLLIAFGLALMEWSIPKLRLGKAPSVAQMSLVLSLFAILLRLIPGG